MISLSCPFRFKSKANSYRAGKGRFYVDSTVQEQEKAARKLAIDAMNAAGMTVSGAPIQITITITVTNKRRFDIDGCLKSLLDSMNGVVWKDDSQIISLSISKIVEPSAANDSTFIAIKEIL